MLKRQQKLRRVVKDEYSLSVLVVLRPVKSLNSYVKFLLQTSRYLSGLIKIKSIYVGNTILFDFYKAYRQGAELLTYLWVYNLDRSSSRD